MPIPNPIRIDDQAPNPILKLLREKLQRTQCRFFVFGPNPESQPNDQHILSLKAKRVQIKNHIAQHLSCVADFPEHLFQNASSDIPIFADDPLALEIQTAIDHYDLVIILAASPGSNVELGAFLENPETRPKTAIFIHEAYADGLSGRTAKARAVHFETYTEEDLSSCHLLGSVSGLIEKIQRLKLLAPL